jgi:hypothetical protein
MRMRVSVIFFVLLVTAAPNNAWAANRYQYVLDATNRIAELASRSVPPSTEDLAKASSEACFALRQLMEDREFRADLHKMTGADSKTRGERTRIKRDLSLFVAAFLRPEEEFMRKAGLKEDIIKEIIWSAAMFRNSLDDVYDPNRIIASLDSFRAHVCEEAKALQGLLDEGQRMKKLRKWVFRMGGISLIIVDVTVAWPTGPVAIGSAAIGATIASWSE